MATRTWAGDDSTTPNSWSVAGNWVENSVPVSTDDVYIPAGSLDITAGLNQSAVTLNSLTIQQGYTGDIGSSAGYLQIGITSGSNVFITASGGTQFIDFGASTTDVSVMGTGGASTGNSALNIIGSALDVIDIASGNVGIARPPGDTATVTTLRLRGGNLYVADGVTLTTLELSGGSASVYSGGTTVEVFGGTVNLVEGAYTTVTVWDGTVKSGTVGTITTLNANGGFVDFSVSGIPRTVTTANVNAYNDVNVEYDSSVVTISTLNQPGRPVTVSWS